MSTTELKTEVIRLIQKVDADRMEDLLATIRFFLEQQEAQEVQTDAVELNQLLTESLKQAQQGNMIPNEQVIKEGKEWLTKLNARLPQGATTPK